MIKNLEEVKKILNENNLNEEMLDKAIQQINETCDYNKEGIYKAELKNFEMTIKRITTFYDENGNIMTENFEDFAEAKDEDTVIDITINGKVYNL
jgi:hypothetical protein|nr:MAG TPA: hypothetical protein [Caudoviricetes sp.]